MPIEFYRYLTCSETIRDGIRRGDEKIVCEGFMTDNYLEILKIRYNCNLEKHNFNGRKIYSFELKDKK